MSGEGSGEVVLEEFEFAKARGAKIVCRSCRLRDEWGTHIDITAPSEDGDGAARCMKMALRSNNIKPEEVDYITVMPHQPWLMLIETRAIKSVFGEHAYRPPVPGTKSMTGHLPSEQQAVLRP